MSTEGKDVGARQCSMSGSDWVRFWAKVDKSGECWEWQAAKTRGYGVLRVEGRNYYAHRLSWESVNGPIPKGLNALHKCDNPACVRPDHLFVGTQLENMHDMRVKGRANDPLEFGNARCKLSNNQIQEIRRIGKTLSLRKIAAIYGIDRSYASRLRSGERRQES